MTRKKEDCGEFWDQAPVFGPVLRPQCGLKTGTTRALQTVSRGLCLSPPLGLLGKHVFQACVTRRITPIATSASLHRFLLEDVLMRTLYLFACRPRRSSGCTKRLLGNPAQALKLVRGGLFFWSRAKQHGLIYYDTSEPRGSQKRIRFGTPRGPEAGPRFGPAGPRNRARGSKNAVQILDRKWWLHGFTKWARGGHNAVQISDRNAVQNLDRVSAPASMTLIAGAQTRSRFWTALRSEI